MRSIEDGEVDQHLKNLDVYGYTQLKNVIDPLKIEELKDKLDLYYTEVKDVESYGRPKRDSKDKMVYNLQNKDTAFIELLSDKSIKKILIPKLNDIYYRLMDETFPNYILSYFNARSSGFALDLHIDSYIPNYGDYSWIMQVLYVLEDMNKDNGCTVVVPGSHKSGKYTDRELKNVIPVHAKAGDIIFWDSRLWHGTLENKTNKSRWGLVATFSRWWIKQNMDMTRSLPNSIYQQLSDEQKLLMGFCSIPPSDESTRIVTKGGYDVLLPKVDDYYS
jgi:ectoine hydroxylase-related dioxygenase (phytanoyl-CoA dioxygenase family)